MSAKIDYNNKLSLREYLESIQESVVQKGLSSFIKSSYLSLSKVISHTIRLFYYVDTLDCPENDGTLFEKLLMDGTVYDLLKILPSYIQQLNVMNTKLIGDMKSKLIECIPEPRNKQEIDKLASGKDYIDNVFPLEDEEFADSLKLWAKLMYLGKKSELSEANISAIENDIDNLSKPDLQHSYSGAEIFKLSDFESYLQSKDNIEEINLLVSDIKSENKNEQNMLIKKYKIKKVIIEKSENWTKLDSNNSLTGFSYKYYPSEQLQYKGFIKDNQYNGRGLVYAENGHPLYEGEFVNGAKKGFGVSYDEDGLITYRGDFDENMYSGLGREYYSNYKTMFNGYWKNDKWEGFGTYYSEDSKIIYRGYYKDNHPHGKGIEYYKNEQVKYDGERLNGKWNGFGTKYFDSGVIFIYYNLGDDV